MSLFTFADDASWNEARRAVEFGVEVGEYQGRVFVGRAVFQALLHGSPKPEACLAAFDRERLRFERAVEAKIIARDLDDEGNVRLEICDLKAASPD